MSLLQSCSRQAALVQALWPRLCTASVRQLSVRSEPSCQLSVSLARLNLKSSDQEQSLFPSLQAQPFNQYILPSTSHRSLTKHTILDPLRHSRDIQLPSNQSVVKEKVTPTIDSLVPKTAPHHHGNAPSYQCGTKWIRVIRHRKVKKHKLRKLRKRLIFLNRKLSLIKKKKKEKMIQLYEKEQKVEGEKFDAEKFIEDEIAQARKGGWHIDPLAGR